MSEERDIVIVCRDDHIPVAARVYANGALAVHRHRGPQGWSRWWSITHVPSGRAFISAIPTEMAARGIAGALEGTGVVWAVVEGTPEMRDMIMRGLGPALWAWLERLRREGDEREKMEAKCESR